MFPFPNKKEVAISKKQNKKASKAVGGITLIIFGSFFMLGEIWSVGIVGIGSGFLIIIWSLIQPSGEFDKALKYQLIGRSKQIYTGAVFFILGIILSLITLGTKNIIVGFSGGICFLTGIILMATTKN